MRFLLRAVSEEPSHHFYGWITYNNTILFAIAVRFLYVMMVRNVFNGAVELAWNKNILAETVGSDLVPAETHEIVVSSDEAGFD